jgi:predicted XRE-type DNA-binding protein
MVRERLEQSWLNFGASPGVQSEQTGLISDSICQKENLAPPPSFRVPATFFADLRLPDAEEKQTKIQLAVVINQIIETTGPSQVAANRLHVNHPEISALANYGLNGFSMNG